MEAKDRPTPSQILELIPQRPPFRFVDELMEVDEQRISGRYTFRLNESFYEGHFPGNPITPGVILLEAMCQVGIVAHGLYLYALDSKRPDWMQAARNWTPFFTDSEVEFLQPVLPGQTIIVRGERVFWRRNKIRSRIQLFRDGQLAAQSTASGLGVYRE